MEGLSTVSPLTSIPSTKQTKPNILVPQYCFLHIVHATRGRSLRHKLLEGVEPPRLDNRHLVTLRLKLVTHARHLSLQLRDLLAACLELAHRLKTIGCHLAERMLHTAMRCTLMQRNDTNRLEILKSVSRSYLGVGAPAALQPRLALMDLRFDLGQLIRQLATLLQHQTC